MDVEPDDDDDDDDDEGKQWHSKDIWRTEPIFDTFVASLGFGAPWSPAPGKAASICFLATPLEMSKLNVSYGLSSSDELKFF